MIDLNHTQILLKLKYAYKAFIFRVIIKNRFSVPKFSITFQFKLYVN